MYLEVLPTVIFYIFKIRPVSLFFLKVVDKCFLFKFKPGLVWMLCLFFSCVFEFFFRAFVCLCVSLSTLLDLCVSLISTNVKTHRIPKRKKCYVNCMETEPKSAKYYPSGVPRWKIIICKSSYKSIQSVKNRD